MGALIPFDFRGDRLDVIPGDGTVHVSIRRACEALDISFPTQLVKLRADASVTVSMIETVAADGITREAACIDLRSLPLWLATIHPSKVRPEVREKLVAYKRECADVLAEHFLGSRRSSPVAPVAPDAQALAAAVAALAPVLMQAMLPAVESTVRAVLAERAIDNGLIGTSRANRQILATLRDIADHLTGAEHGSREWKAAHRGATNDLRDGCNIPHRGAWASLPVRHFGDIVARLDIMLRAAERNSKRQRGLFPH